MTVQDQISLTAAAAARDRGDLAGAERIAKALLADRPDDIEALCLLAEAQDRQKAIQDYTVTLARLMALAPSRITPARYRLLAKAQIHEGNSAAARATLTQALSAHPGDLDLHIMLAGLAGGPAEVADALEAVLPVFAGDDIATASLLKVVTASRAKANRAARGLPVDAVSWEDTSTWADPEGLARVRQVLAAQMKQSQRGELVLDAACLAINDKNWEYCDKLLQLVRSYRQGTFADCTAFGPQFHAELDRFDLAATAALLPPVERILNPPHQSNETMLLASDPNYFERFTLPFIATLERMRVPADVQVHIMGGDLAAWYGMAARLAKFAHVRVGLSAEDSGPFAVGTDNIRLYCHAIRFVRLYQEVAYKRRPTWVFDVDVFLEKDPRPLLARLADFDISFRTNPYQMWPPGRVAGNLIGIAPTPLGLEYARRVAAYILYWKQVGTWSFGVDQVALDSAYVHMDRVGQAPKTYFQGPADAANGAARDCIFYFPTGANKYIAASAAPA